MNDFRSPFINIYQSAKSVPVEQWKCWCAHSPVGLHHSLRPFFSLMLGLQAVAGILSIYKKFITMQPRDHPLVDKLLIWVYGCLWSLYLHIGFEHPLLFFFFGVSLEFERHNFQLSRHEMGRNWWATPTFGNRFYFNLLTSKSNISVFTSRGSYVSELVVRMKSRVAFPCILILYYWSNTGRCCIQCIH